MKKTDSCPLFVSPQAKEIQYQPFLTPTTPESNGTKELPSSYLLRYLDLVLGTSIILAWQ